jgi:drug/metabolite transporter (DMT)-like permease
VYVNINPLVAATLAAVLLDERLTPLITLFAAVVAGVLLVNRARAREPG